MKFARLVFAILAMAALSVGCSDLPTDTDQRCPIQGGPHCTPDG
jgi:hypothetical protein